MFETGLGMATSNGAQRTVPLWLYVPRNFSSNTELGIRSPSLVRRNRNKERPYELLIMMAHPPAAQHPFKIQILFKSNRLCWALSCGSLSTAALGEKESDGCSRKRNQLEAPWCPSPSPPANMLLSRESLSHLFWEDSNLYPPNVQQELYMWGPPKLSFLLVAIHHPRPPELLVSCTARLHFWFDTQVMLQVCGSRARVCSHDLFFYLCFIFPSLISHSGNMSVKDGAGGLLKIHKLQMKSPFKWEMLYWQASKPLIAFI